MIVRPNPLKGPQQRRSVKGIAARVDFPDFRSSSIGVFLFDDSHEVACLIADDAAQSLIGIRDGRSDHATGPIARHIVEQSGQRFAPQQRGIAVEHENRALVSEEMLAGHHRGVPRPLLFRLNGKLDVGFSREQAADDIGPVADDHNCPLHSGLPGGCQHVFDHRPTANFVGDFRQNGLHPGAFSGGQHDRHGIPGWIVSPDRHASSGKDFSTRLFLRAKPIITYVRAAVSRPGLAANYGHSPKNCGEHTASVAGKDGAGAAILNPRTTGDRRRMIRLSRLTAFSVALVAAGPAFCFSAGDVVRSHSAKKPLPAPIRTNDPIVSFIDQQIRQGWTENDVVPSPAADDEEWLRRVHLDLVGHIPAWNEIDRFHRDKSPAKRAALVDKLLDSPSYVRNWTTLWTNLTIGRKSMRFVNRTGMERFFREAFAQNRPWNEIVHDLVAAEGRSDENGAVNYLLAQMTNNDEAVQATAKTTRLFMGIQVQCTQCHDHPFNEWKQNRFWEINSFLRQTRRGHAPQIRSGQRPANRRLCRADSDQLLGAGLLREAQRRDAGRLSDFLRR